jgi:hypothetical protein
LCIITGTKILAILRSAAVKTTAMQVLGAFIAVSARPTQPTRDPSCFSPVHLLRRQWPPSVCAGAALWAERSGGRRPAHIAATQCYERRAVQARDSGRVVFAALLTSLMAARRVRALCACACTSGAQAAALAALSSPAAAFHTPATMCPGACGAVAATLPRSRLQLRTGRRAGARNAPAISMQFGLGNLFGGANKGASGKVVSLEEAGVVPDVSLHTPARTASTLACSCAQPRPFALACGR